MLPMRRLQMLGDSLGLPRLETPERPRSGTESAPAAAAVPSQASSAAGVPRSAKKLQNLHKVDWHPSFEAPNGGAHTLSDPPSLGIRQPSGPAATAVDEQCGLPGRAGPACESIVMDALTLGPPHTMQHALIKFVGKKGKELGEGVMCVGELLAGKQGRSTHSKCSFRSPSTVASGGASSSPLTTRHRVDLRVGGRLRGSAEFDLALKAKREVREEAALQEAAAARVENCSGGRIVKERHERGLKQFGIWGVKGSVGEGKGGMDTFR